MAETHRSNPISWVQGERAGCQLTEGDNGVCLPRSRDNEEMAGVQVHPRIDVGLQWRPGVKKLGELITSMRSLNVYNVASKVLAHISV